MDAEADLSPRILHLIRQAQVVDEVLRGAQRAGVEVTNRVRDNHEERYSSTRIR